MGSFLDFALQRGESVRNGCIYWLAFDEKRLPTHFLCPSRHVKTTMIYTHVLNRGPAGVRSPLDGM